MSVLGFRDLSVNVTEWQLAVEETEMSDHVTSHCGAPLSPQHAPDAPAAS